MKSAIVIMLLTLINLTVLGQTNGSALLVGRKPSEAEYKAWLERNRLERERTAVFLQSTNTATLAELQKKGIDIRFREILSVDYTASGRPIVRRRWVMCSEAFGEPLNGWATK